MKSSFKNLPNSLCENCLADYTIKCFYVYKIYDCKVYQNDHVYFNFQQPKKKINLGDLSLLLVK